jgi:hypothetical protein
MAHTPNTNRSTARCSRRDQRTNYFMRCFNAMRANGLTFSARRASGVILPMIAAMLLLAAAPREGWSQPACPANLPPPCTPWSSDYVTAPVGSGGCSVNCYYCYCYCSGTVHVFITEVIPNNSFCDGIDPQILIDAGVDSAIAKAIRIGAGPIPICPGQSEEVTKDIPSCWEVNAVSGQNEYTGCSASGCYCEITEDVCFNSTTGNPVFSNCSSSQIGSCSCTADPWPIAWVTGTCYALTCPPCP